VIGGLAICAIAAVVLTLWGESKQPAEYKLDEADCKKNLSCWGHRNIVDANDCGKYIEKFAKYSFEWTNNLLDGKFSRYRWHDESRTTLTFRGDSIRLQNGFGAWQDYIYECDYDPSSKEVLNVRLIGPGRL